MMMDDSKVKVAQLGASGEKCVARSPSDGPCFPGCFLSVI